MQTQSFGDYDQSPVGTVYKAVCKTNHGYEYHLTEGKIYTIIIAPRILPMSPLCSFMEIKEKCVNATFIVFIKLLRSSYAYNFKS